MSYKDLYLKIYTYSDDDDDDDEDDDDDPPEIFWFLVQQPLCGMIRLIFFVQTARSDGMFATYSTRGSEPTYIMAV